LVQCPGDVEELVVADPLKVAWLSQTTLSVDETNETVSRLRVKFPALIDPPSEDICYATQNRQSAAKLIAPHSDLVIVVGSKNSSNSTRLAEVALQAGAKAAHQVEDASEMDPSWLVGVDSVGIAAGASAPRVLIDGVLEYLEGIGASPATEERFTEEDVSFSLPAQLRKDLRGLS
jgi:4-hydroxy-3-methylbut-2-en-1-yl diphosphate reductase